MLKLKIISVGKTKEEWLETAIQEYVKRLSKTLKLEFAFVKDDDQLVQAVSKEPLVICLDPDGVQLTSEQFSSWMTDRFQEGGSRLAFAIGGPFGLPSALKHLRKLSLSPLTLTHQIVRLVLVEQVYRALEIARGSSYHK